MRGQNRNCRRSEQGKLEDMVLHHGGEIRGAVTKRVSCRRILKVDIHDDRAIHLGVKQALKLALDGLEFSDGNITPENGFLEGDQAQILQCVE